MAVGNTRRSLHGHAARRAGTVRLKRQVGFALSAVTLTSVIAVTAGYAVITADQPSVQAQEFSTPEPTLTGMGTAGQDQYQVASQEEVAIMAAAEVLTVSESLSDQTPEILAAKAELELLLKDFAQIQELEVPVIAAAPPAAPEPEAQDAPDTLDVPEAADVAALTGRGDKASRNNERKPLADVAKTDTDSADQPVAQPEQPETQDAQEPTPVAAQATLLAAPLDLAEESAPKTAEPQSLDAPAAVVSLADVEDAVRAFEELLGEEYLVTVTTVSEVKAQELESAWDLADQLAGSTSKYSNGNIPRSAMSELSFAPGHYIRADAAVMLELLNVEFRDTFGYDIRMTDSYRSYASQVVTKANKGYLAARPGTSNHGWGLALDLRDAVAKWGTAERNWLVANGSTYGWVSPNWAQRGNGKEEPWHWEFEGRSVSRY